jgi:hypothetical protein
MPARNLSPEQYGYQRPHEPEKSSPEAPYGFWSLSRSAISAGARRGSLAPRPEYPLTRALLRRPAVPNPFRKECSNDYKLAFQVAVSNLFLLRVQTGRRFRQS